MKVKTDLKAGYSKGGVNTTVIVSQLAVANAGGGLALSPLAVANNSALVVIL